MLYEGVNKMSKSKISVIAWYKHNQNSQPTPIYARLGYGKHKEYIYVYENAQENLFKFKEDTDCIEIDRYVNTRYGRSRKKTTIELYIEQYECDTKQILEMILKARSSIYSIDAMSREEIIKKLTKEAVVRRLTK